MSFYVPPETMKAKCPECGEENEVLWFPANKFTVEIPGTRAGKTKKLAGRNEKVEGKCKCGYKFKTGDL